MIHEASRQVSNTLFKYLFGNQTSISLILKSITGHNPGPIQATNFPKIHFNVTSHSVCCSKPSRRFLNQYSVGICQLSDSSHCNIYDLTTLITRGTPHYVMLV
jgi:hypothetical protein